MIESFFHLAERAEAASGPDRALDSAIESALGWPNALWTGDARAFSASIDAARQLLPDGWVCMVTDHDGGYAVAFKPAENGYDGRSPWGRAQTAPLALVAAGLRALATEAPDA